MPRKKIPIAGGKNANMDEIGLSTLGADLRDAFLTGTFDKWGNFHGSMPKRPGLTLFCNLGTGQAVDGIYWWNQIGKFVAVSNGHTFSINNNQGNFTDKTGASLNVGVRPTFANHGSLLLIQNGGKMQKFDGTNNTAELTDPDAPTTVKFGDFLDSYALAAKVSDQKFYYSEVQNPESWLGSFMSPEGSPDNITAMLVGNREIHLIGPESWEIWENSGDATLPFIRKETAFVQRGVIAPYSVRHVDSRWWMALAANREIIVMEGRTPTGVSPAINRYIQSFGTVTDALADELFIEGRKFYILSFPIENKTLVLDVELGLWYEWGHWNSQTSQYDRWRGNCVAYSPAWNMTLVGDHSNGYIYKLDPTAYADNGDLIRCLFRSGNIDWGTGEAKCTKRLIFKLKRTAPGGSGGPPTVAVRWRDNGESDWGPEETISLDATSFSDYYGEIGPLGQYRSRQYEVVMTSNMAFSLVSIEEDFEFMAG